MPTLAQVLVLVLKYKYAIMLPLAIVEGPILSVMSGFLLHQGYVTFWPTYFTLMAGDLIGDTAWYSIGKYAARPFINRFGHKFGFTPTRVAAVERIFKKHQKKTLIMSKLSSGFGLAPLVLMTAGSIGISFPLYILLNVIGQFLWSGMLITVGYYFGQSYELIDSSLRTGYLIAGGLAFAAGLYALQRHLRRKATSTQSL